MAIDLRTFDRKMEDLARRVGDNADTLTRNVALATASALIRNTPVDKGTARSNWRVSIDTPLKDTIPAYAPGEKGSTADANTEAAIENAKQVIVNYKFNGQFRTETTIHIRNNLPYIDELNNGHSGQAPAGFVEMAILSAREAVQNSGGIVDQRLRQRIR